MFELVDGPLAVLRFWYRFSSKPSGRPLREPSRRWAAGCRASPGWCAGCRADAGRCGQDRCSCLVGSQVGGFAPRSARPWSAEHHLLQDSGREKPSALSCSSVVNAPRERPGPSPPAPPPPGGRAGSTGVSSWRATGASPFDDQCRCGPSPRAQVFGQTAPLHPGPHLAQDPVGHLPVVPPPAPTPVADRQERAAAVTTRLRFDRSPPVVNTLAGHRHRQ